MQRFTGAVERESRQINPDRFIVYKSAHKHTIRNCLQSLKDKYLRGFFSPLSSNSVSHYKWRIKIEKS